MTHKFDVSHKHKLDNEKRRSILPPEETLIRLGLKKGDIMADMGCGIGYFTIPASYIVGDEGKVYALDISDEMVSEVKNTIKDNNINNVEVIKTSEYDFKIPDGIISCGFICNVLHELEYIDKYLNEAKRVLVQDGRLIIIEWEKKASHFGPPVEHRLDKKNLEEILKLIGFRNVESNSLGEEFYSITAQK